MFSFMYVIVAAFKNSLKSQPHPLWAILVCLLFSNHPVWAATESVSLSEALLKSYVTKGTPNFDKNSLQVLNAKIASSVFENNFSLSGFASGNHKTTKEKPFISFSPVYSPHSILQMGLKKRLAYGIDTNIALYNDLRGFTLSGVDEERTIASVNLGIDFDLFKNFLGRLDKASLRSHTTGIAQAKLKQKINNHNLLISLRQLYWRLVANDSAQEISKQLLTSATEQVRNSQVRFKSSVADRGEVARYKALASSRQSSLTYLQFQAEELVMNLKKIVPQLLDKKIVLQKRDLDVVVTSVLTCVAQIKSSATVPLKNTLYDELIKGIRSIEQDQLKIASTYDDIDLKLTTAFTTKGVEPESSDAIDDAFSDRRTGVEIGLQLVVPLGFTSTTEAQKIRANHLQASYETREILQNITSAHHFIRKSIEHLIATVKSQGSSRDNLKIRIQEMEKKYHQGRITVTEFISDQDSLFQTELQILDSKTMILNVLFNYLSIFTETPCDFNRI